MAAPAVSVMVTKMLRVVVISLALSIPQLSYSEDSTVVVDCAAGVFKHRQLGQLAEFKLGEKVTQLYVLQEALTKLAQEADILARIEPLPSEMEGIFEESLTLLEGNSSIMYSCLFNNVGPEGSIHKFTETESNETRYGYIAISRGKKIAYFYQSVVVI